MPSPRGETSIEVTFMLDASGILQVRARDAQTGQEQRASLDFVGAAAFAAGFFSVFFSSAFSAFSALSPLSPLASPPAPPAASHHGILMTFFSASVFASSTPSSPRRSPLNRTSRLVLP